jgi:alpha-amylase/alpha-mannosidase (GH57 family)
MSEQEHPSQRYICIHGHFYQPPRENPWLEAIEAQDGAYPYHDWNERITAECYAPNALSRILDEHDRIIRIINNYARISFDFGPTLLSWLESRAPEIYAAVIQADRESREAFDGHGSAMAQAYNHMILPLANRRDKVTQVRWGLRDFDRRFGRKPEGIWLPETAVDLESLDILAEHEIRFTVLSPHQAARVRRMEGGQWEDVSGGRIDPRRAYRCTLPSGRTLSLFFYDGEIARAVAFEGLLTNGERFARRLVEAGPDWHDGPQLVHIATDGETYGHHHRHGEMALAYALDYITSRGLGRVTNYGAFLERCPPIYEVEIHENTSWSCTHGVERWRSNCGCRNGFHAGADQAWRTPLREALDLLRDSINPEWENRAAALLNDPWAARDDYVDVILNRSKESVESFLSRHAKSPLSTDDRVTVLRLLELQRHAMLMYTSCGWFFDDLTRIETVQILQYAARAIQLAERCLNRPYESELVERLAHARSHDLQYPTGREVYARLVKPAVVGLKEVCAHYAVSSLFESYEDSTDIFCYRVERKTHRALESGKSRLAVGSARITSQVTGSSSRLTYGVLHLGDHNLTCGVRDFRGDDAYRQLMEDVTDTFANGDFADVIRRLDQHFEGLTYSLRSLFRDEQRKIIKTVLDSSLAEAEAVYRQLYEDYAPLMRFLSGPGSAAPRAFQAAAEFVLNTNLHRAFEQDDLDLERIQVWLDEAQSAKVSLDKEGLAFALRGAIESRAVRLSQTPDDLDRLEDLERTLTLLGVVPFEVDLWKTQNIVYDIRERLLDEYRSRAEKGDVAMLRWVNALKRAAKALHIHIDD